MERESGHTEESEKPAVTAGRGELFLSFLRLGCTAFGGPAMVVYIRELAVRRKRWLPENSFENGVALCQSIPGATSMQMAGYVGLRAAGPAGALAAFVGFGVPAFVLMLLLSAAYGRTASLAPVMRAFEGMHMVVLALVAEAAWRFARRDIRGLRDVLLAAAAGVFLIGGGSPMMAVAASGVLGLLVYWRPGGEGPVPELRVQSGAREAVRFAALFALVTAAILLLLFAVHPTLRNLATAMVRVGLFAFGGGFGAVPLMLHEVVVIHRWLGSKAFLDGITLGQITPGPVLITATFVGYEVAGPLGAVVATAGAFAPSFLILVVSVPYFDRLQRVAAFRRAMRGVLVSFVGLLAALAVSLGMAVPWGVPGAILAAAAFAALRLKVDVLWVVLAGAAASVLVM
jgi:chromate transporter